MSPDVVPCFLFCFMRLEPNFKKSFRDYIYIGFTLYRTVVVSFKTNPRACTIILIDNINHYNKKSDMLNS